MPPPLTHDWDAVRATALATGSLKEAAKAHDLTYNSVLVRAHREKWLTGRRLKKKLQEAQNTAKQQIIKSNIDRGMNKEEAVMCVRSTSEVLEQELLEGKSIYLASMNKGIKKLSNTVEKLSGEELFKRSKNLKEIVETGHKLYGLNDNENKGSVINLNILSMGAESFVEAKAVKGNVVIADE